MRAIRGGSTEYLRITIVADVDISDDATVASFDGGITWHALDHVGAAQPVQGSVGITYRLETRLLVGPSGRLTLPAGTVPVLVRVTDSPEVPEVNAGTLVVTA